MRNFNSPIALMLPPLYVRRLSETEQVALEQGLGWKDGFTLRRCQIVERECEGNKTQGNGG